MFGVVETDDNGKAVGLMLRNTREEALDLAVKLWVQGVAQPTEGDPEPNVDFGSIREEIDTHGFIWQGGWSVSVVPVTE